MLTLTGYQPQLHSCLACHEALEPTDQYFHVAGGGVLCPEHGPLQPEARPLPLSALKLLRFLQREPWESVAPLQLSPTTRYQVETLLLGYLTFLLERRLKSVDFLRHLQRTPVDKGIQVEADALPSVADKPTNPGQLR
jgi:DNA repair protein RecO (recombination protein O)